MFVGDVLDGLGDELLEGGVSVGLVVVAELEVDDVSGTFLAVPGEHGAAFGVCGAEEGVGVRFDFEPAVDFIVDGEVVEAFCDGVLGVDNFYRDFHVMFVGGGGHVVSVELPGRFMVLATDEVGVFGPIGE
ncbi:MAG: hypothetical protein RI897_2364 [Verrucomicrobiota bacterium]